jgi:hypothetical protein
MLLTVKKQIEETVEFKTPAYYKDICGHHFINESEQIITVRDRLITIWEPAQSYYQSNMEQILNDSKPCDRAEFETAYNAAMQKIKAAVDDVEINS